MRKPLVGLVATYVEDSIDHIFSNGLYQNIYTLYEMLQKEGTYEPRIYTTRHEQDANVNEQEIEVFGMQIKLTKLQSVVKRESPVPDLFIEVGAVIPDEWIENFYQQNPNLKVVTLKYGNVFMDHVAAVVAGPSRPRGTSLGVKSKRDAVWVSPHFVDHMQFYKWHYDAKIVAIAPYVWSTRYIDSTIKSDNVEISDEFGRVAVVEPNLSVLKNAIAPIAIIDVAAQKSDSITKGLTFCTEQWRSDPYNVGWIKDLHVYKSSKLTFNPRYKFARIFSKAGYNCGTLLAHQFQCELNYAYLEALHLGIPLVHNSSIMKDAGYYYKNWEIMDGADMLIAAVEFGREGMSVKYRENAREVILRYSPDNFYNIKGYVDLIEEVLSLK